MHRPIHRKCGGLDHPDKPYDDDGGRPGLIVRRVAGLVVGRKRFFMILLGVLPLLSPLSPLPFRHSFSLFVTPLKNGVQSFASRLELKCFNMVLQHQRLGALDSGVRRNDEVEWANRMIKFCRRMSLIDVFMIF